MSLGCDRFSVCGEVVSVGLEQELPKFRALPGKAECEAELVAGFPIVVELEHPGCG